MNSSILVSLTLLSILLTGCNAVTLMQSQLAPTTLYSEGSNIRITMPGDNPPGTYKLETITGELLVETPYQQHTTSRNQLATGVIWFRANLRRLPESAANACLRIRKPDGTFLPVQTGVFSERSTFKIPVLEYMMLENVSVPALRRDIALVDSDRQLKVSMEKKLAVQAGYKQGQCIYPDRGPKPANACFSQAESDAMSGGHCVASNLGCSVGGETLVQSILNNPMEDEKDLGSLLSLLSQNACSVAVDRAYNQQTNFWTMLRSIFVGIAIESLYRDFINSHPDVDDKLVIASLSGLANTYWCMSDAYSQCSANADNWLRRFEYTHQQCTRLKRQLDDVKYRLHKNEPRLDAMKAQLKQMEGRMEELRKSGSRRGWLNQGAESC